MAVSKALETMEELLADKYKDQEWEKRCGFFALVEKLAKKDSAILEFIQSMCLIRYTKQEDLPPKTRTR